MSVHRIPPTRSQMRSQHFTDTLLSAINGTLCGNEYLPCLPVGLPQGSLSVLQMCHWCEASMGGCILASCLIASWQQRQACSQYINPPIFIYLLQVLMKQFPHWIIIFPLLACQDAEREMEATCPPPPPTHRTH